MKQNKRAGFWIRFSARIIDITIFAVISICFSLIGLDFHPKLHFKNDWFFYVWGCFSIVINLLLFLLIPYFWKRTIGMFICQIRIDFENNKFISLVKREMFLSLTWVFSLILSISLINHTLINKFARTKQEDIKYSTWENLRIAIFTTMSSMLTVVQFTIGISLIVRRDKIAWVDSFSKTKTVWIRRYEEIKAETKKEVIVIKPKLIEQAIIEWV